MNSKIKPPPTPPLKGGELLTRNPFSFFAGIVCINLPERADRRKLCVEEFGKLNLTTSPLPPLLEERGTAHVQFFQGIYCKPGEMKWQGCKNSHLAVIRMAKERGWKSVLIFEDDFEVKVTDMEYYAALFAELRDFRWELFYLGGNPFEMLEQAGSYLFAAEGLKCAHAYAVHENVYDLILEEAPGYDIPIDRYYKNFIQPRQKSFIADRFCVGQRPGWSNILGMELDYSYMERKFFEATTGRVPIADPYEGRRRRFTPEKYKPV